MHNDCHELQLLKALNVKCRFRPTQSIKEVSWIPPDRDCIKIKTDGYSRGNPGIGGAGFICRDSSLNIRGVFAKGLGVVTNYEAECHALIEAAELAADQRWNNVWFEADSTSLVQSFGVGSIPWQLISRWKTATRTFTQWKVTHTYREVNFGADYAAKHGAHLAEGASLWSHSKPEFVKSLENPYQLYFRFN